MQNTLQIKLLFIQLLKVKGNFLEFAKTMINYYNPVKYCGNIVYGIGFLTSPRCIISPSQASKDSTVY